MKRILVNLVVLLALVGFTSCQNEHEKRLKKEVEKVNKECPINMGIMGDVLSMTFDEQAKEVGYYYLMNEQNTSVEAMRANEDLVFNNIKLSLSQDNSKELINLIVSAGYSLVYRYKSPSSEKEFSIKLSLDDLRKIQNNPLSTSEINRLLLDNLIAFENARNPHLVGEGMEMTKVEDDGENVVYYCRLDEDMYDITIFEQAQAELKDGMKEMLKDPIVRQEANIIQSNARGLTYRYYGEVSGISVDVNFPYLELRQAVK